ncbi:MAG: hypothetical protein Q9227_001056 [Pyrenula ochraceoflavens]
MQLTKDKSDALKSWVVKRLEDISDADPDVLGDFVLALLKSDASDDEIRRNSIENLEDFLKDHTQPFVDELFVKFVPNSASAAPAASTTAKIPGLNISTERANSPIPIQAYDPKTPLDLSNKSINGLNQGRKRSRNEQSDRGPGHDPHYFGNTRTIKAPRGPKLFRDDPFIKQNGYKTSHNPNNQAFGTHNLSEMPFPPAPLPGMPALNPQEMMDLMAMQAAMFPEAWNPKSQKNQYTASQMPKTGQRCKDYDLQGYCVRGDSCPHEHGNDHIVASANTDEYDPSDAFVDVPRVANGHGMPRNSTRGRGIARGGRGRGGHGNATPRHDSRAEFSDPRPNFDKAITTIVVEQIPEEQFEETLVRDFFSQYGNVLEVTMKPYKRLALVKYSDWASAKRAYESPKVIFDNRFVKVYWYKPNEQSSSKPSSAKNAMANHAPTSTSPTSASVDEPLDRDAILAQQAKAQKDYETKAKARKEMEEARQALQDQQEQVTKKHEAEKAELLAKIAAKESLKKGLQSSPAAEGDDKVNKSLRDQLAKLEAEARSLGIDPNAPAAEESYSTTRGGFRGRGRGRAGYQPTRFPTRGRGSSRGSYRGAWTASRGSGSGGGGAGGVMRLDNRPKRVAISGVEWTPERDEALRQYLFSLGPFDSIDHDPSHPETQIISYPERYMAEQLMYGKSDIPGVGKVEFSWVAGPSPVQAPPPPHSNGHSHDQSGDGDVAMSGGGGQAGGGDESEGEAGGEGEERGAEGTAREVEYDVAEEDDWGIE